MKKTQGLLNPRPSRSNQLVNRRRIKYAGKKRGRRADFGVQVKKTDLSDPLVWRTRRVGAAPILVCR